MTTAILIMELVEKTQAVIAHQLHETWENALETIRTTHCNCKDAKIVLGRKKIFGDQTRQAIKVRFTHHGKKRVVNYLLTEMYIHKKPDHI